MDPVSNILDSFEALPDPAKWQVASAILRRSLDLDLPPLSDADLTSVADELFVELDRSESQGA